MHQVQADFKGKDVLPTAIMHERKRMGYTAVEGYATVILHIPKEPCRNLCLTNVRQRLSGMMYQTALARGAAHAQGC